MSIGPRRFAAEAERYTRAFLARARPDFHIVELADSISHRSSLHLLRSPWFRVHTRTLVYVGGPTHEAAAQFLAYARRWLGLGPRRIVLSGPLANEARYEMARAEIRARLGVRVCPSARWRDGGWWPDGRELAGAILAEA